MNRIPIQVRRLLRPQPAWCAVGASLALAYIGIGAIAVAQPRYAGIQLRWLPIALAAALLCILPPPRYIGRVALPLLGITTVLLVMVLLPFMPRWVVPVRNGATCWINLYFMMFQPSEVAKITFVLALAWYLRHDSRYRSIRGLIVPCVLMGIPFVLTLMEPDLGSALIFIPAWLVILVAAGSRLSHLGALVGIGVMGVVLNVAVIYALPDSMQVLKPHQRQRIISLVSRAQGDNRYRNDIGYQQDKAITLVGSGGLTGYGLERSTTMVRFNKLPADHNDMIFAVIVNRWGLAGGLATLGLYLVMIISFLLIAARSKDPFARLSTVGLAGLIFSQAAINIGMTLGLLPITGITLPFVSYGGSSLVATFAMVGLVVNFASRRQGIISKPSFEFTKINTATG